MEITFLERDREMKGVGGKGKKEKGRGKVEKQGIRTPEALVGETIPGLVPATAAVYTPPTKNSALVSGMIQEKGCILFYSLCMTQLVSVVFFPFPPCPPVSPTQSIPLSSVKHMY